MKSYFLIPLMLLLGACTTTQSVGTAGFNAAWSACGAGAEARFASCMMRNPSSTSYTPAEKELISYFGMIIEKRRRGLITNAEAQYYLTAYARRAKEISNYAEERKAAAIGSALGATIGTAAYIADRRCRAAGTC